MGRVFLDRMHFQQARGWLLLLSVIVGLLFLAGACGRTAEDLTASETAVLAAAESLIRDFDLDYSQSDRDRMEGRRWATPTLRAAAEGGSQHYRVNAYYPYLVAPLVLLTPWRGAALANALLLAVAAWTTALVLSRRIGSQAPVAVTLFLVGSVTYRNVFVAQPTLLSLAAVVGALALVFREGSPAVHGLPEIYRPPVMGPQLVARWATAGVLLGVAASDQLALCLLAVPVVVAAPVGRRAVASAATAAGLAGCLVLALWIQGAGSIGGDLMASVLPEAVDVGLTWWNLVYLLIGRNIGMLPYFFPMVALLGLWRGGESRSSLVVASVLTLLAVLVLSPFDLYGGPAAVGNRWLAPIFAALWFLPTRPLPRGWLAFTALLASPMMLASWLTPSVDLVGERGNYIHSDGRLNAWLPVETSQRQIPRSGEIERGGLRVSSLDRGAVVGNSGRWQMRGGQSDLLVASLSALDSVHLQFDSAADSALEVRGGELGDMVLQPDGGVGFRIHRLRRVAYHPPWWSDKKHHFYRLRISMPGAASRSPSFSITAFAEGAFAQHP